MMERDGDLGAAVLELCVPNQAGLSMPCTASQEGVIAAAGERFKRGLRRGGRPQIADGLPSRLASIMVRRDLLPDRHSKQSCTLGPSHAALFSKRHHAQGEGSHSRVENALDLFERFVDDCGVVQDKCGGFSSLLKTGYAPSAEQVRQPGVFPCTS